MSKFQEDLLKETILSQYLDVVYTGLGLDFQRVSDTNMQYRGADLIYSHKGNDLYIDEKAQLNYLNKDLPTFTFELSYLKNDTLKQGWLFDEEKITDHYFLITGIFLKGIYLKDYKNFRSCKITSVDRTKLIEHLNRLGLTRAKLEFYDHEIRQNQQYGKHAIEEINPKFGSLFFTEHLSEQPINLQLKLKYLMDAKISKRIFPNA